MEESVDHGSGVREPEMGNQRNLEKEVRELRNEVSLLNKKNEAYERELSEIKETQGNMQERLRAQERYSRKDSVFVKNPPFDARNVPDVTFETIRFFKSYLETNIHYDRIKACHIIPNSGGKGLTPTVICKFIYFADKDKIFSKRRLLRKKQNFINKKNIYINEVLPEKEAEIQQAAADRDMITSTHNCMVSVLVENGLEKPKFVKINNVSDLDKINAVKRKRNGYDDQGPSSINEPARKRMNYGKQ